MTSPGVYRHYKYPGNLYRVLFTADWIGEKTPKTDSALSVVLVDGDWFGIGLRHIAPKSGSYCHLISALWSGNKNEILHGDPVVIYVALYGAGRVSARRKDEFEDPISVVNTREFKPENAITVQRFENIGL